MKFLICLCLMGAAFAGSAYAAPKKSGTFVVETFWVSKPSKREMESAFPAAASARGIEAGRVVLGCTVLKGGHLECAVNSEKPAGLGFGAAAMKLSSLFQMAAKTGDGMATEGVRLSLPMNFRVPRNRARA